MPPTISFYSSINLVRCLVADYFTEASFIIPCSAEQAEIAIHALASIDGVLDNDILSMISQTTPEEVCPRKKSFTTVSLIILTNLKPRQPMNWTGILMLRHVMKDYGFTQMNPLIPSKPPSSPKRCFWLLIFSR